MAGMLKGTRWHMSCVYYHLSTILSRSYEPIVTIWVKQHTNYRSSIGQAQLSHFRRNKKVRVVPSGSQPTLLCHYKRSHWNLEDIFSMVAAPKMMMFEGERPYEGLVLQRRRGLFLVWMEKWRRAWYPC